MVDKLYKPMRLPSELEQPQLSTDLDWIFTSSQSSIPLMVELLVNELSPALYRLGMVLLGDEGQVKEAVQRTFVRVMLERHRYRSQMGVTGWVFKLLTEVCHKEFNLPIESVGFPGSLPGGNKSLGSSGRVPDESTLQAALDKVSYKTRLILVFHYLYRLSITDISAILGGPDSETLSSLENARRWINLFRPAGIPKGEAAEDWARTALERVWPARTPPETERRQFIASTLDRLDRRSRRKQVVTLVQQLLFLLVAVSLITIAGWTGSRIFGKNPSESSVSGSLTPGAPSSISDKNTSVSDAIAPPVGPTKAPTAEKPPLNASSDPEEIRQRMYESRGLWNSVWVDAEIIRYSQPGYVGPMPVYRNQMWIRNPNQVGKTEDRLVLSGQKDGTPVYAMMIQDGNVSEIDLQRGVNYRYPLGDTNPFYDNFNPVYLGIYGFDDRGLKDGSFLASMIFAAGPITNVGQLEVIKVDHMLEREVLVVANVQLGTSTELMYIDTRTGMILRWLGYGGREMRDVLAEIDINQIKFEPEFSAASSFSSFFTQPGVKWLTLDSRGVIPPKSARVPEVSQQRAFQHVSPPPQFNSTKSCLTLQWPAEAATGDSPGEAVDLFGDRYYLGTITLGDPRYMKCKRSMDGALVGCLSPPPGLERAVFAGSNLFWFHLSELKDVNNAFPDATWISSDFAFSPDGTTLAFWGCKDGRNRCGIFLEDMQNKDVSELVTLRGGATYFNWSPDGKLLSYIVDSQSSSVTPEYMVVSVPGGEILRQESVIADHLVEQNKPENPDLGSLTPGMNASLDSCIQIQE